MKHNARDGAAVGRIDLVIPLHLYLASFLFDSRLSLPPTLLALPVVLSFVYCNTATMLPLFYAALFLAAGSNASPCKLSTSSSAPATAGSSGAATPGGGVTPGAASAGAATGQKSAAQVKGSNNNLAGLATPSNSSSSGLVLPPLYSKTASAAASTATASIAPVSGGGSCPDGFINTVFNTGAPKSSGWPDTTWSSLSGNGVKQWSTCPMFQISLVPANHLQLASRWARLTPSPPMVTLQ